MTQLSLLSQYRSNQAIHIAANDMIHITWKHVTLRINVTGLIYLIDFMNGDLKRPAVGFEAYGTLDDGFQLWIEDVGLRLSTEDCHVFKQLLIDALATLRAMGKNGSANHLSNCLKLTIPLYSKDTFSSN